MSLKIPPLYLDKSKNAKTKLEYEVHRHVLSPNKMPFRKGMSKEEIRKERQKFVEYLTKKKRREASQKISKITEAQKSARRRLEYL